MRTSRHGTQDFRARPRRGLPRIVADLMRPEAYPAPRPERVLLRATHASWVFLTGNEAWKVKRPVDLGFLDFSTAEKRLRCAADEVRLGERLASDVYRGVAPVFATAAGHSFVGPGAVVDHAVRMRRLRDEDSALALAAAGRLSPAHLAVLADRLASFFQGQASTPPFDAVAALGEAVHENLRVLERFAGRLLDARLLDRVAAGQRTALAAAADRMRRRQGEGFVREGHGDLRLEHVYFADGRADAAPLVIDPIEFNDRLRWQDQGLDVAFLAMEIEALGRPDLAAWLLSCFARASGDYGFFALLDLFVAYRACVRAKVACLAADDSAADPGERRRRTREIERLLTLAADRAAGGGRSRWVIAIGGLVGAGKTTLAEALGRALALPVISSDLVRKQLGGIAPTEPGPATLYADDQTRRTLAEMVRRAGEAMAGGRGVVLDATFRRSWMRGLVHDLAVRQRRPVLFVEAVCDEGTLRARLRGRVRAATASDADEAVLERIRAEYEPPAELPAMLRLAVETRVPVEDQVRAVLAFLAARRLRDAAG